jgi:MinD-like ATPase involved in chromosome partitioning or flagellar assembly
MSFIAITSGKGSPGTTTLALALAATARCDSPLLVEADASGGDIAARAGLGLDPGLLTLAAAGRRGVSSELVAGHSQRLLGDVRVLLAPTSPGQALSVLSPTGEALAHLLSTSSSDAIVDVGRWDSSRSSTSFVANARHTVLVFRPTVEGVERVRSLAASLERAGAHVVPTVVGERPYTPLEVRAALASNDLLVVEHDPRAASALASGGVPDRWLRRSPLLRSAAAIATELFPPAHTLRETRA